MDPDGADGCERARVGLAANKVCVNLQLLEAPALVMLMLLEERSVQPLTLQCAQLSATERNLSATERFSPTSSGRQASDENVAFSQLHAALRDREVLSRIHGSISHLCLRLLGYITAPIRTASSTHPSLRGASGGLRHFSNNLTLTTPARPMEALSPALPSYRLMGVCRVSWD